MIRRPAALLALLATCALAGGCGTSGHPKPTGSQSRGHAGAASKPGPRTYRSTGGLKTVNVQSGGHQRTYLLYVPPGDARNHRLPLVLVFHGADDTAAHTTGETDLLSVAERSHNMILVFAQGYEDTWNEGAGHTPAEQAHINDVAFAATILRRVEGNYAVDPRRVVATGFSNGALLTEDLGCALSPELTLIVPVEGQLPVSVSSSCHPPDPVGVYAIQATADSTIPYNGGPFSGVGGGTTVLSAPNSTARWATLDHCSAQPQKQATRGVTLSAYGGCADQVTVTLASIDGGQHSWPPDFGQTLVAAISSLSGGRQAIP
jgi:polyhydroxybutyrate depolymerase